MTRLTVLLALGAGVVVGAPLLLSARPEEDHASRIHSTLALNNVLAKGREHMQRGHFQAAVDLLETQLPAAGASKELLSALREAYVGLIQDLRRRNEPDDAKRYALRLQNLDPGALLELGPLTSGALVPPAPSTLTPLPAKGTGTTTAAPPQPPTTAALATGSVKEPPEKSGTFRGAPAEEAKPDPFDERNSKQPELAKQLLARAEQEFLANRFAAAGGLYDQAQRADRAVLAGAEERWAYCKLFVVFESLKRPDPPPPADLEREVRLAMSLTPKLDEYAKNLLQQIHGRQGGGLTPVSAPPAEEPDRLEIKHSPAGPGQHWALAETTNFRVFHNQSREVAEKAARVAEAARATNYRKWFGDGGGAWNPKCDLYLHASAHDYSQATGQPGDCPGHSTFNNAGERIVSRRVDIHVDVPEWWVGVLPHETTHVVLAGRFGPQPLPRWADEGMAVLAEPRDRIERHLRNLPMHRRNSELFGTAQLLQMDNYPEPRRIGAFYAESVSLCEYLSRLKGSTTFAQFVRDGTRGGFETALRQHYGINSFAELDSQWTRYAFAEESAGR